MEVLYSENNECCGCNACVNICPQKAIELETKEGFLYPYINKDLCIDCKLCEKVCPMKNSQSNEKIINAYGVKNKDLNERKNSSSGSVYIEAAKYIINQNGAVYGVVLDSNFEVYHKKASSLEEIKQFQGSKYVQSKKGDVYKKIKEDLLLGKKVLFTGTPCENAGLRKYLQKEYENLYTIDIICHGVPSQEYFKQYILNFEKKKAKKVKKICFREKSFGWRNQELNVDFEDNSSYHKPIWEDQFYRLFTGNYILRDSCYSCKFANLHRMGDITIGDFWNIKNIKPEFEDTLGVSSVFVNSKKGKELFENICNNFELFECEVEDCKQHNLYNPSNRPEDYDKFKQLLDQKGFVYCVQKFGKMGIIERLRRFGSKILHKLKIKK